MILLIAQGTKLSHIFRTIEEARDRLSIVDYTISQTSLEQVFLSFAKDQAPEDN